VAIWPFSILERIDVGETTFRLAQLLALDDLSVSSNGSTWVKRFRVFRGVIGQLPFSILERIDVGETSVGSCVQPASSTFSILERIDVGETSATASTWTTSPMLSVSSNGSTWVKL